MPNLEVTFCGVKSPNPFWLASAPPTNTGKQVMRAFEHGWGGAVWKTLGNPIVNVSSRFAAMDIGSQKIAGFSNIELITDRPLDVNLREMAEVKKRFPKNVLVASLMVETKEEWKEIIRRSEDTGADLLELNFGCPHGMCERQMGSAVGQQPKVLQEITSWAVEYAQVPVIVKLTPNISHILEPGLAAVNGGAHALSLINTIKSIVGVDLDTFIPVPTVSSLSTNGGYCGPAVKPIALHMVAQLARHPMINVPISGVGGISNWRDAAEFLALGATTVQVCTAVMHHGYRVVEDMLDGLSNFMQQKNILSLEQLIGKAVPAYKDWGDLDLNYHIVANIDESKCIGCNACYAACLDGAHQCIYLPNMSLNQAIANGHEHSPANFIIKSTQAKTPWVDENHCVGCNLCSLVCPIPNCITMQEKRKAQDFDSWNQRIIEGRAVVPGGLNKG